MMRTSYVARIRKNICWVSKSCVRFSLYWVHYESSVIMRTGKIGACSSKLSRVSSEQTAASYIGVVAGLGERRQLHFVNLIESHMYVSYRRGTPSFLPGSLYTFLPYGLSRFCIVIPVYDAL